jgi:hypothetical protein
MTKEHLLCQSYEHQDIKVSKLTNQTLKKLKLDYTKHRYLQFSLQKWDFLKLHKQKMLADSQARVRMQGRLGQFVRLIQLRAACKHCIWVLNTKIAVNKQKEREQWANRKIINAIRMF